LENQHLPNSDDLASLTPRALVFLIARTTARVPGGGEISNAMFDAAIRGDPTDYVETKEIVETREFNAKWMNGTVEDGWWSTPLVALADAWRALGASRLESAALTAKAFQTLHETAMNESVTSTSGWESQQHHALHILQDYELIREAFDSGKTPIDPGLFGPLGAPREVAKALDASWGWRRSRQGDAKPDQDLVIEMEFPEGTSREQIAKAVREAADVADETNRAYGGRGLEVSDLQISREPARAGVTP
jgi:hypothetical protein